MKKAVTLFFLFLFLFFIIGYKGVFTFLQYKAEFRLDERLDNNNYSQEETISLKLAITLPYQINNTGYQRVNGTFEHEGEYYHIVKQKLENDTLYVVCIKNQPKKKILDTLTDFEKIANNIPSSDNNRVVFKFIKDYIPHQSCQTLIINGWLREHAFLGLNCKIDNRNLPLLSPPPELRS